MSNPDPTARYELARIGPPVTQQLCERCGGEGTLYTSRYGGNDPDVWPIGQCSVCEGTGYELIETEEVTEEEIAGMDDEMVKALQADGEMLRSLTGEDHGPYFVPESGNAPDPHAALDRLAVTVNRIADERNELLAALKAIVADYASDIDITRLTKARIAIDRAEGRL